MANAMRNLFARMGCANNTATFISAANDGGINNLQALGNLTDSDVDQLAVSVRRPGGLLAGAPHPGFRIPCPAAKKIKLAAFCVRYHRRINEALVPADVTNANINPYAE